MAIVFREAERKKVRMKIGISAISGGGKTTSSLLLAYGMIKGEHPEWDDKTIWHKICVIDSENGSGEMYTCSKVKHTDYLIGKYYVIPISAPFTVDKYVEAVNYCKKQGIEVCIIDSMTHLWNGVGSLLEKQSNIARRSGNSYTAWRTITPEYTRFIDTILQVDMHVIATMRSKQEYVQEKGENGKSTIRKVGMAPIMRDGIEYEFSLFMDIDSEHQAHVTKDRTGELDNEFFVISPQQGVRIAKWLASGEDMKDNEVVMKEAGLMNSGLNESAQLPQEPKVSEFELNDKIEALGSLIEAVKATGVDRMQIANIIKSKHAVNGKPTGNYKSITDVKVVDDIISELEKLSNEEEHNHE